MHFAWSVDLLRELRFFWPPGVVCSGPSWSFLAMVGLGALLLGICLGSCCTLTAFSPGLRRGILVAASASLALVVPSQVGVAHFEQLQLSGSLSTGKSVREC